MVLAVNIPDHARCLPCLPRRTSARRAGRRLKAEQGRAGEQPDSERCHVDRHPDAAVIDNPVVLRVHDSLPPILIL